MRYEIVIREFEDYTEEELKELDRNRNIDFHFDNRYSDKPVHFKKVLQVELTPEEYKEVKKQIINVF